MSAVVPAVDWLLESDEPGIVAQAKRDLLDEQAPAERNGCSKARRFARCSRASARTAASAATSTRNGAAPTGGSSRSSSSASRPASRAVSRPRRPSSPGSPARAIATGIQVIDGLTRRCASQEGNALAVCCRLGLADDPRVRLLAESLVEWQWPDGGWNCDKKATGYRSSFNESLPPMWGLHEYWAATGETAAREAAERTAELFLEHRLFRALATGDPIRDSFVTLHSPPFWHYDFLQALVVLARMGLADDPRAADGLDLLEERRLPDGRWRAGGRWWKPPGSKGSNVEVVDWGSGPSELLTLHALRVLRAAGRPTCMTASTVSAVPTTR